MKTKLCRRCGQTKPVAEFNKRGRDGHQPRCRSCQAEVYQADKPAHARRVRANTRRYRAENRERMVAHLKENRCVDCGESDPIVLQFDHREPSEKSGNVSALISRGNSWSRVLAEIEKCDVRCANCHMRRTAKQFGWKYRA